MAIVPLTEEDYQTKNRQYQAILEYLVDQSENRIVSININDITDSEIRRIQNTDYFNFDIKENIITLSLGEPIFEVPDYPHTPGTSFKRVNDDLNLDWFYDILNGATKDTIPGHEGV